MRWTLPVAFAAALAFALAGASGAGRPPSIVAGPGEGAAPVIIYGLGGDDMLSLYPYDPSFAGGVRVATGDVNGDGVADIVTAPGPGMSPTVKVFDGQTAQLLRSFLAYDAQFRGGVYVAAGDLNGDGVADIVTGPDKGTPPTVRFFDGRNPAARNGSLMAFDPAFAGGVRVAVGDVNGDGKAEIVAGAGPGGSPEVKVFEPRGTLLRQFLAYDAGFAGGIFVAAGDVNGDGRADLVTGPDAGMGPLVKVFNARNVQQVNAFFAYDPSVTGGVRVAADDLDGDGKAEVVTGAQAGDGPHVKAFVVRTGQLVSSVLAYQGFFIRQLYVD